MTKTFDQLNQEDLIFGIRISPYNKNIPLDGKGSILWQLIDVLQDDDPDNFDYVGDCIHGCIQDIVLVNKDEAKGVYPPVPLEKESI